MSDVPKLVVGAAILGGGIYGLVTLLLKKKKADELEVLAQLHQARPASAPNPVASVRGSYGWNELVGRGGAGGSGPRGHHGSGQRGGYR